MVNKKGQFYLIAALIIIAIIASLILKLNFARITPEPLEFKELSENFEQEALQIIDQGVFERALPEDTQRELQGFADKYSDYTNQKAPNAGFLYVFSSGKDVSVVNYLLENAKVSIGEGGKHKEGKNVLGGNALTLHRLTFEVGGEDFIRDLEIKANEFRGINLMTGQGNYVKINVGGIPYNIAITNDIQYNQLTIKCEKTKKRKDLEDLEECNVILE